MMLILENVIDGIISKSIFYFILAGILHVYQFYMYFLKMITPLLGGVIYLKHYTVRVSLTWSFKFPTNLLNDKLFLKIDIWQSHLRNFEKQTEFAFCAKKIEFDLEHYQSLSICGGHSIYLLLPNLVVFSVC
jgi:hypothetical protein